MGELGAPIPDLRCNQTPDEDEFGGQDGYFEVRDFILTGKVALRQVDSTTIGVATDPRASWPRRRLWSLALEYRDVKCRDFKCCDSSAASNIVVPKLV